MKKNRIIPYVPPKDRCVISEGNNKKLSYKYIMNEKHIMIEDTGCWVYKLPNFISKYFVKTYTIQGAVYVKKHGIDEKPVFYSDTIKGLEILKIISTSEKRADKLSFEYYNKKYPQYGEFIKFIK